MAGGTAFLVGLAAVAQRVASVRDEEWDRGHVRAAEARSGDAVSAV